MKKLYIILLTLSFILSVFERCSTKIEHVQSSTIDSTYVYSEVIEYDFKDSVYYYIMNSGIEHPDIVYAQAILETGHFKSDIFKNASNLFGMKMPKKRETKAIGIYKNHAEFNSWIDSIDDYKLWQEKYASNKSRNEYFKYLSRVYSQDSLYVSKLKHILNKNEFFAYK